MGVPPGSLFQTFKLLGTAQKDVNRKNNIKGWGRGLLISLLPLYNMKISLHVINPSLGRL